MMGLAIRPYIIGGVILALLASHSAVWWQASRSASAKAEARAAQATINQLKERGLINEAVRNLDDCALLRELNRDSVCDGSGE